MVNAQTKQNESTTDTIEEKLYVNRFCPDTESHIKVNSTFCNLCPGRECTKFCPANVFSWCQLNDRIIIGYENCLECGACNSGCPFEAIDYLHPKSGYGVL